MIVGCWLVEVQFKLNGVSGRRRRSVLFDKSNVNGAVLGDEPEVLVFSCFVVVHVLWINFYV